MAEVDECLPVLERTWEAVQRGHIADEAQLCPVISNEFGQYLTEVSSEEAIPVLRRVGPDVILQSCQVGGEVSSGVLNCG